MQMLIGHQKDLFRFLGVPGMFDRSAVNVPLTT
jgi:hypothetical protein